MTWKRGVVT